LAQRWEENKIGVPNADCATAAEKNYEFLEDRKYGIFRRFVRAQRRADFAAEPPPIDLGDARRLNCKISAA
jgi:hypothetical protein